MAVYQTYRSVIVQKKILSNSILAILEHNSHLPRFNNEGKTVWEVLQLLQELLLSADLSKVDLYNILHDLIAANHNAGGEIPKRRALELLRSANFLIDRINIYKEAKDYRNAWHILSAFLAAFVPAYWRLLQYLPHFPAVMNAFGILAELSEENLDDTFRAAIFQFCHEQYPVTPNMRCCNIQIEWLFAMAYYVEFVDQEDILLDLCRKHESPYKDEPVSMALTGDETLQVQLILYRRCKSPAAVIEFIHANIHDDSLRKKAITLAMTAKDYDMACELCIDRIANQLPADERLGLYDWYVLLLEAALRANDVRNIAYSARWLFGYTRELKYYRILKANTSIYQWEQLSYELMEPLRYRKDASLLLEIFLEEKAWEEIENILPHLHVYDWLKYESLLAGECASLLEKHFDVAVWSHVKNKWPGITDRDMIAYLERMQKRFGEDKVANVISLVKACYPRRKNLHAALKTVR